MLKIRLMRIGTSKRPFYRVVAVDERKKRTGGYLELLGTYNPLTTPKEIKLDQAKIDAWMKKGAQPSDGFLRIIGKAKQRKPRPAKKQKKETPAAQPTEVVSETPTEVVSEAPVETVASVAEQAAASDENANMVEAPVVSEESKTESQAPLIAEAPEAEKAEEAAETLIEAPATAIENAKGSDETNETKGEEEVKE